MTFNVTGHRRSTRTLCRLRPSRLDPARPVSRLHPWPTHNAQTVASGAPRSERQQKSRRTRPHQPKPREACTPDRIPLLQKTHYRNWGRRVCPLFSYGRIASFGNIAGKSMFRNKFLKLSSSRAAQCVQKTNISTPGPKTGTKTGPVGDEWHEHLRRNGLLPPQGPAPRFLRWRRNGFSSAS
jgi:hypothetical protein